MTDSVQSSGSDRILRLWERIQGLPPQRQAMEMLLVGEPGPTRESVEALSIGERDNRLLDLHERLFGPQLQGLADCPGCGERVEMGFRVDDIRAAADSGQRDGSENRVLTEGGWRIEYRLPTAGDLAEIGDWIDRDAAHGELLRRCVLAVDSGHDQERETGLEGLPEELLERVVQAMADADPQADVELRLACPGCGHQWQPTFDIVSYLVAEVDVWARRILTEVARLGRGYGWSEADILAMSPVRRQAYLELLENL